MSLKSIYKKLTTLELDVMIMKERNQSEQIKTLIQKYCEYDLKNYKIYETIEDDIPKNIILIDTYDSYEISWNGLVYLSFPDGFYLLCELDELDGSS